MEIRKRLLLTGGATGIGRAVAMACAPPASVVVADVNVADADTDGRGGRRGRRHRALRAL